MASYMAKVYANRKKKIEEVPEKIRAEVEELLNAQTAALFITEEGGGDYGSHLCNPYC